MSNRFKNTLYTPGDYKRIGRHIRYITNEDGTLFSGHYRTKIRPEDLPEWYLYGRYYKRFGYMSTKGITDMLYIPSRFRVLVSTPESSTVECTSQPLRLGS